MSQMRIVIIIFIAVFVFSCSLFLGPRTISPFALGDIEREILFSIRLPRIVVAMLMGMALGASGAVLQGVLRNPLADPYILGISSGASPTAAPAIIGRRSSGAAFTVGGLGFIGAIATG